MLTYKSLHTAYTPEEIAALSAVLENGGNELTGDEYTKASNNRKFYRQTIDLLRKRAVDTEKLIVELRTRTEIPSELSAKAARLDQRIAALRFCHDAYLLAGQKLTEASTLLRSRITPALSGEASQFIRHATENKYDSIGVSEDFSLSYHDGVTTRTTEYLSCGTKDLAYLGLRLGLMKILYQDDAPTMIFDESFARLDDRRLATVFTYLKEYADKGRQVLILTSGKRERKYADTIGNCQIVPL